MTKRQILSTLRRHGAMYASELGGNHPKLFDMCCDGLILATRCSDRRYLYTLTESGRRDLDRPRGLLAGIRKGLEWPVTLWRRLFK